MQPHDPRPLVELKFEDLGGGLNEAGPPDKIADNEFVVFKNARVCLDGISFEKRPGLSQFDSLYSFGGKRVHGSYGMRDPGVLRTIACLEDSIRLKSSGAWSTIFSPTKTIDEMVEICQYKGLTFVGGYEKLIAVLEGQANYAGIEAPPTPPTVTPQAAGTSMKAAEYPQSNQDSVGELRSAAARTLLAQGFEVNQAVNVSKVKLKLRKLGSPSGNLWVEIHSSVSGTSAAKNTSTNIVGQASDNVAASGIGSSFASQDFTFSGTKPPLSLGVTYYLVVYGDFSVSSSAFVLVGLDASSPSYGDGRYWEINGSLAWTGNADVDLVFELYETSSTEGTLESFGTSHTGNYYPLRYGYSLYLLAQSFIVDSAAEVTKVKIPLKKICQEACCGDPPYCPSGQLWVEIHSSKVGTSATKNASTNIVGQASADVDLVNIVGDFDWVEFTFSGTKPTLAAATTYHLVLYGNFTPHWSRHVAWSSQAGYADGEHYVINDSMVWSAGGDGEDHSFEIIGTSSSTTKRAEYALANLDDIKDLRETTSQTILAQEFIPDFGGPVVKVNLWLSKLGSPSGNLWVELHSAQGGTSTTKNASTNIMGQASDNVAASGISAFPAYTQYTFTFSGTKPNILPGTTYYLVLYGDFAVSDSAFVMVAKDKTAPTAPGSCWNINGSLAWTEIAGVDLCYEVYASVGSLVGIYRYCVTFVRTGNYLCESNPSEPSAAKTVTAGQEFALSAIPISSDPQVNARRLYRTYAGGEVLYFLTEIPNNTAPTFTDNIEDIYLGDQVFYDHSRPPAGTTLENWDGKLWVAGVPDYDEFIFSSKTDEPEHFDLGLFLTLREKKASKVIRIKEFNNDLYGFKAGCIWQVSRSGSTEYAADKVIPDVGLGAAASLVEIKGTLMFLSNHFQIEVYSGGNNLLTPRPGDKVARTLKTINKAYAYRSVGSHYSTRNEYRLAIPTGTNQWPDTVIVFDYARNKWAVDTHPEDITAMDVIQAEVNEETLVYGTISGHLWVVNESAVTDAGVAIVMDVRHKLLVNEKWTHFKRTFLDFECPGGSNVTFNLNSNLAGEAAISTALAGSTPSGSDADLRALIHQRIDMNVQGNAFNWRLINGDSAARVRVSGITFYIKQRAIRQTIKAS